MNQLTSVVLAILFAAVSAGIFKDGVQHMHPTNRQNTVGPQEELVQSFWHDKAIKSLKEHLDREYPKQLAKNIVFFIGDGMSLTTVAAARIYMGQLEGKVGENEKLSFEKFPAIGLSNTYCVNAQVADSACSATAYLGGVKANDGTIGVSASVQYSDCSGMNNETHHVESIAYQALKAGKSAGIVTTTRITHASPAGAYAYTSCRNWESDADVRLDGEDPTECRDIAYQLVRNKPGSLFQVILGGGRSKFFPVAEGGQRQDGINLVEDWKQGKQATGETYQYVENKADLLNAVENGTENIFGLFQNDHMDYHLLQKETQPTLEEMTEAAIEILSKNENGFFLFVEGGRIDHAHHGTKAHLALDETVEMAKAVDKALEMTDSKDTLIVVTSDHSHTMTLAGYPSRGNDILGPSDLDFADDTLDYITLSYANGPGYRREIVNPQSLETTRVDVAKEPDFVARKPEVMFPGGVPMNSETHGGEDVLVFARGPWQHLFTGSYEQNLIPHMIGYAMCLDEELYGCSSANKYKYKLQILISSWIALLLLTT